MEFQEYQNELRKQNIAGYNSAFRDINNAIENSEWQNLICLALEGNKAIEKLLTKMNINWKPTDVK